MHLIFDFDGTIIDSFQVAIEKFNLLSEEFNFRKISSNEISDLKNLSSKELVKYLKIPIYKIPRILFLARKYMNNKILTLAPFENIHDVLKRLYDEKFSLGILTSNSIENVTTWLDMHKMNHFFSFIHAGSNFFGKDRALKRILKKYAINKSEAFYIGDETRDIDAAKKNNIYSMAVTWGFNSEKILLAHQPHYVARKPEDILVICGLKNIMINSKNLHIQY